MLRVSLYRNGHRDMDFPEFLNSLDELTNVIKEMNLKFASGLGNETRYANENKSVNLYVTSENKIEVWS